MCRLPTAQRCPAEGLEGAACRGWLVLTPAQLQLRASMTDRDCQAASARLSSEQGRAGRGWAAGLKGPDRKSVV